MKKWDIVILAYPFTDLASIKARPAVVISPDSASGGDDAVFIAITSNTIGKGRFDVFIATTDPEFPATGLRFPSMIKVNKLFTLKKTLAARPLGVLGPVLRGKVEAELRNFFEFPPFQPGLPTPTPVTTITQ